MKNVTVLNGIPDEKYTDFEKVLEAYSEQNKEHVRLKVFTLRNMDIKYCTGCWSCWVKTPGLCPHKDQMPEILRSVINSDLTVLVSPVVMGFVSKYIKKVNDRMIPLVHPHIGIFNNECHHYKRYERYPKLGLMLLGDFQKEASVQAGSDCEIITDIYRRMALNLRTELAFSTVSSGDVEVLKNEISNI